MFTLFAVVVICGLGVIVMAFVTGLLACLSLPVLLLCWVGVWVFIWFVWKRYFVWFCFCYVLCLFVLLDFVLLCVFVGCALVFGLFGAAVFSFPLFCWLCWFGLVVAAVDLLALWFAFV